MNRQKAKASGPRLRLAATLWTLLHHPTRKREWSLARKVKTIAAAGFEGVQASFHPQMGEITRKHGLALLGAFDAEDPLHFDEQVRQLKTADAVIANVQVAEHDTSLEETLRYTIAVLDSGKRHGLKLQIETHRGTATETPEKFSALASAYRDATGELLPVTWDHSHFAVTKHMRPEDYSRRLLTDLELIGHSRLLHCRPFNGHHCQIALTDSRGRRTPEYRAWLLFAQDLFAAWISAAPADAELWVVVEQGSALSGYNLSVFNAPWTDALVCAEDLRRIWNDLTCVGRAR
jgi:hypothetical protein